MFKHSDRMAMAKCAFRLFGPRDLSPSSTTTTTTLQNSVVGKPDSPCFGNMKRNNRAQKRNEKLTICLYSDEL
jgi:hypothetical protein